MIEQCLATRTDNGYEVQSMELTVMVRRYLVKLSSIPIFIS